MSAHWNAIRFAFPYQIPFSHFSNLTRPCSGQSGFAFGASHDTEEIDDRWEHGAWEEGSNEQFEAAKAIYDEFLSNSAPQQVSTQRALDISHAHNLNTYSLFSGERELHKQIGSGSITEKERGSPCTVFPNLCRLRDRDLLSDEN